jgi:hypothetical protein
MSEETITLSYEEFRTRTRWAYHFTINESRVIIPVAEVLEVDNEQHEVRMSIRAARQAGLL